MDEKMTVVVTTSVGDIECLSLWEYNEDNSERWEGFRAYYNDTEVSIWRAYDNEWRCTGRSVISEIQARLLLLKTPEEAVRWGEKR